MVRIMFLTFFLFIIQGCSSLSNSKTPLDTAIKGCWYSPFSQTYLSYIDCIPAYLDTTYSNAGDSNETRRSKVAPHVERMEIIENKYVNLKNGDITKKDWKKFCDSFIEEYPSYRIILWRGTYFYEK